mgnify:CR=1 FL=1
MATWTQIITNEDGSMVIIEIDPPPTKRNKFLLQKLGQTIELIN